MKLIVLVSLAALVAGAEVEYRDLSDVRVPAGIGLESEGSPFFSFVPLSSREGRVVGGKEVNPGDHPYQVVTLITDPRGRLLCGGSIISADIVLTAAHCCDQATEVEIIAGAHNIRIREPEQQTLFALKSKNQIKFHEGWNPSGSVDFDIGLYLLDTQFVFGPRIQPIALPKRNDKHTYSGEIATVSGWGVFDSEKQSSDVLRAVDMEVKTNLACNTWWFGTVTSGHICCKGSEGKSSCNGDSGGPLVAERNKKLTQIGVVSFGNALGCSLGYPSVYSRTSYYLEWIEQNSKFKPEE